MHFLTARINAQLKNRRLVQSVIFCLVFVSAGLECTQVHADNQVEVASAVIETDPDRNSDKEISERIQRIYAQIDDLSNVTVNVQEGVVLLSGAVSNEAQARRALQLANRLEGVVTVDDDIERRLDVEGNILPLVADLESQMRNSARALPLYLLAFFVFLAIAYLGHLLARWQSLWHRLLPNPFLADLVAHTVRVALFVFGLVAALSLIGATALTGTILGGAGVLGLAIGFAVKDTMENYISSVMLSLRQPFRANDHVLINEHEGRVVRLTSRATVLMTLDGNHLRIPNSVVFKAVILNYSTNPERAFSFTLGADADRDALSAMKIGSDALSALEFTLKDPRPGASIIEVGDSNIIIKFIAWVDQQHTDFWKARSLAVRAVKAALEEDGFMLPEPTYRVRMEQISSGGITNAVVGAPAPAETTVRSQVGRTQPNEKPDDSSQLLDVSPDKDLEDKVVDERALTKDSDLLDANRPAE